MKWNPYQDAENRAYSSILTTLFPEQTKTLPRIIVWSFVFLLDLIAVVAGGSSLGLIPGGGWVSWALLGLLFGVFRLQGALWGCAEKGYRRCKEKRERERSLL